MIDRKAILDVLLSIESQMDQKNMAGAQADLGLLMQWINDSMEIDSLDKKIQHTDGGW
jgi:hypothetical protein